MAVLVFWCLALAFLVIFLILTFSMRIKTVKGFRHEDRNVIKISNTKEMIAEVDKNGVRDVTFGDFYQWVKGIRNKGSLTTLEFSRYFARTHLRGYRMLNWPFPTSGCLLMKYEDIKEMHSSANFDDRVIWKMSKGRQSNNPGGLLQNTGASWQETRKYTMRKMGQLGFGKKAQMQEILNVEKEDFLKEFNKLKKETGNKIPVHDLFENTVINIIWGIAAGERFCKNDPNFIRLKSNTKICFGTNVYFTLLAEIKLVHLIINLFPSFFGHKHVLEAVQNFPIYFKSVIEKRQKLGNYKFNGDNFIDNFLSEIDLHANTAKSNVYNVDNLAGLLVDLFEAGMDTTSGTLASAMIWMIKYPDVQKKIQQELDEVVGRDRMPTYFQDAKSLPYAYAALLEVNRITNMVANGVRLCSKDSIIGGVLIKKGTSVYPALHFVRMDQEFWGDPEIFRPERLLDSDKNLIKDNVDRIMAFGGGSRICIGEIVAMATAFDFFTAILHRYTIKNGGDKKNLRLRDEYTITNATLPFHLSVFPR